MSQVPPTGPGGVSGEVRPPAAGEPQFDLVQPDQTWPKVVGITSIVLGSLGLLCNVCGIAGNALSGMAPQQQNQITVSPGPIDYGLMCVGTSLAVLLLTAGVLTNMRREVGRVLHIVYGLLAVPTAIFGTIRSVQMTSDLIAQMQSQSATGPQPPIAAVQGGMYVGICVSVVMGIGWPIFCLVWFLFIKKKGSLAGVRDEQFQA
ncbi:MAG TPA: hypothetical protein VD971_01905 [Phycisphaerales bacterium]|nr:hypothetical protein [Phycisphaerales bacterium]